MCHVTSVIVMTLVVMSSGQSSTPSTSAPKVTFAVPAPGLGAGYRLADEPSYFITAPRKIRPDIVYKVSATILRMKYHKITIRVSTRREQYSVGSGQITFERPGTKIIPVKIDEILSAGHYGLKIEGIVNGSAVFTNVTDLIYDPKPFSLIIQTSKPYYYEGIKIRYRAIPFKTDLMPWHGRISFYLRDGNGNRVKKHSSQFTNVAGVISNSISIEDTEPKFGTWSIKASFSGASVIKSFPVDDDMNGLVETWVVMPGYILENTFGLTGWMESNHSSTGAPVQGNGTVKYTIRIGKDATKWKSFSRHIPYYRGRSTFLVTFDEIRSEISSTASLAGAVIHVEVDIFDYYYLEHAIGEAECHVFSKNPRLKFMGDKIRTFKPNVPFTVYVAASMMDGTPLSLPRRNITFSVTRQNFGTTNTRTIIPSSGITSYTVTPKEADTIITIRALYESDAGSQVELRASKFWSRSGSILTMTTSTMKAVAGEYMIFTVVCNDWIELMYYQVVAKGNIIVTDSVEVHGYQKTFTLVLSRDMAPSCRMVVYYFRQDSEVVADAINFFVNFQSNQNDVKLWFNRGKDFSGDSVEIKVKSGPLVFMATGATLADLHDRGVGNHITEEMIVKELMTYDNHVNHSLMHTWRAAGPAGHYDKTLVTYPAPNYAIDSNLTFTFTGLHVFTDALLPAQPTTCNRTLGYYPCFDGSCYQLEQWCNGQMECADGRDEMGCSQDAKLPIELIDFSKGPIMNRHAADEEWAWKEHFARPSGSYTKAIYPPASPRQPWVFTAFSMSRSKGLGLLKAPVWVDFTRTFYMVLSSPETNVVKGEMVGIHTVLFNYWSDYLEVLVTLPASKDYSFIHVEKYGIVRHYDPRLSNKAQQILVYLYPGEAKQVHFAVIPKKSCEVSIIAETTIGRRVESVEISVSNLGIKTGFGVPYFLDLVNIGSVSIPAMKSQVPEQAFPPRQAKQLYVPGSEGCTVEIIGDVVGTTFKKNGKDYLFQKAEGVIGRPSLHAEGTVFNFAASLYTLNYLRQTSQLPASTMKLVLAEMAKGLQRMLRFMRKDGAILPFASPALKDEKPSLWVTVMMSRIVHEAKTGELEKNGLHIKASISNKLMSWILTQQDNVTGEFYDRGPLLDRKMATKIGSSVKNNVTMTAHALLCLVEAGGLDNKVQVGATNAKELAKAYLEDRLQSVTEPHQVALLAYTLHKADSKKATDAFHRLKAMNRTDNYWSSIPIKENDKERVDGLQHLIWRKARDGEGFAVEGTAYALMTYLLNNRLNEAKHIMEWLQYMKNSPGGWRSTRDTIVALQALSEYAIRDPNREIYDIDVEFRTTGNINWKESISLKGKDFNTLYSKPVGSAFGTLRADARGKGTAFIKFGCKKHVLYSEQMRKGPVNPSFFLSKPNLIFTGRNYSIMAFETCVRWKRLELGEHSGMAVIEVDLPTGYMVFDSDMEELVGAKNPVTLRRARQYGNKVRFFYEKILSTKDTCVKFNAKRWYSVANITIEHMYRVYEYYEPMNHNSSIYETFQLFNLDICKVCGSFQCPYCPFYNKVGHPAPNIILMVAIMLVLANYIHCNFEYNHFILQDL